MATLEEVAREAGVSRYTVSNVLRGRNKENWACTVERAERIRAIATRLNYRPNAAAVATATGRFGAVGLLASRQGPNGALLGTLLNSIRHHLTERELHLTLGDLPDESLTDEAYVPRILREWSVDGLLINYIAGIPDKMIELIGRYQIPSVWLNAKLESDCVYPDDFEAAQRACKYLLDMGHRRIAYVDYWNADHYSVADRRNGYLHAMRSARLKPQLIRNEREVPETEWLDLSCEWLRSPDRPTAVIAYEADRALPVFCAALKLGLDVPRDLSILSFHDMEVMTVGVRLTTMEIPMVQSGSVAVEMVNEKISNPGLSLPARAIKANLIEGTSCAPPTVIA
ncbi:MAG TPA: LacI family DNA-binding transcriptional regulator [Abditibacteriaceae bacterium]|jgi:LacI family transcriptional regulator